MKSMNALIGYTCPLTYFKNTNLGDFITENLKDCNGKLAHDREFYEYLINNVNGFCRQEGIHEKKNAPKTTGGITESMFVDKFITDEMRRPISIKEGVVVIDNDNENEISEAVTRYETDDVMIWDDNACRFGRPSRKLTDKQKAEYNLMITKLSKACLTAIIEYGITRNNGMHYKYFTTGSSGIKTGKSYFVSDRVYEAARPMLNELAELAKEADIPNAKFLTQLSLLFTSAKKIETTPDFHDRIAIRDIDDEKIKDLFSVLVEVPEMVIFKSHDKSMNPKLGSSSYDNGFTDGGMLINSDFLSPQDMHAIQVRMFLVKGFAVCFSFSKYAAFKGYTDEQCMFEDMFTHEMRDIRECSCVLTKDAFKGIKLMAKSESKTYAEFERSFGFEDLYAVNEYENHVDEDETFNWTKQFSGLSFMTLDTAKHIASRDLAKLKRLANAGHEELVSFANSLYNGQAMQSVVSLDVDNGSIIYTDEVASKIDEAYNAMYRKATQSWSVKGHALKAFPDLVAYFAAILGIDDDGMCGKGEKVYASAFSEKLLCCSRSPVQANDSSVVMNMYHHSNPINQFVHDGVIYFGKYCTAPKRGNADFDGDTINVTADSVIVKMVNDTNRFVCMPMVGYYDCKDAKYIVEEKLAHFDNSCSAFAATIAYGHEYSAYVGTSAAIISRICGEINRILYSANSEEEFAAAAKRASEIYIHDLAPMAQTEQLAVDASKTLAFYHWDYTGSVLGAKWYEETDNRTMVTKEYTKEHHPVSDRGVTLEYVTYYRSEAEHPANSEGWEEQWFDGTNIGMMHDIFAKEVPAHILMSRNVKLGENYMFDKDDFDSENVPTSQLVKAREEHPFDKRMFKQENRNYYLYLLDVTNEFGDMPYHSGYEAVARKLHAIYTAKDMRRTDKVAVIRNLYNVLKNDNDNAYACMAQAYAKGIIGSEFFEMTSTETEEGFISDAALFVASEGKF